MALQVLPMITGLYDSAKRIGERGGFTRVEEFDAPLKQDLANALLTFYGGNALSGLSKPKGALGAGAMREAEAQPIRAYHGTNGGFDQFNTDHVFFSTNPEMANVYSQLSAKDAGRRGLEEAPSVIPADLNFLNTMRSERGGAPVSDIQRALEGGHDSIDMGDGVYIALKRGTVKSPLTGGTLFSDNKPSIFGGALATAGEQPRVLPMDQASRMARAKEMGFDTDTPLYHGTRNSDGVFDSFKPSQYGSLGEGVYLTSDASTASGYAMPQGSVYPAFAKGPYMPWDEYKSIPRALPGESVSGSMDRMKQEIQSRGYTGVQHDGLGTVAVLDPSNIRSVNAAFDPAKADSANLLYSRGVPLPPQQQDDNLPPWLKF
jgi:hypothetical protein